MILLIIYFGTVIAFVFSGIRSEFWLNSAGIQAQNNDLDIIADKVLQIISAKERIHLSSPKEVLITVENSYMDLKQGNIEIGTTGEFIVHAASHKFLGPKSMPYLTPEFGTSEQNNELFVLKDKQGKPVANFPYKITGEDGTVLRGITNEKGEAQRVFTGPKAIKLTFAADD